MCLPAQFAPILVKYSRTFEPRLWEGWLPRGSQTQHIEDKRIRAKILDIADGHNRNLDIFLIHLIDLVASFLELSLLIIPLTHTETILPAVRLFSVDTVVVFTSLFCRFTKALTNNFYPQFIGKTILRVCGVTDHNMYV